MKVVSTFCLEGVVSKVAVLLLVCCISQVCVGLNYQWSIWVRDVEISQTQDGKSVLLYAKGWTSTYPAGAYWTELSIQGDSIVLNMYFFEPSDSTSLGFWEHTENVGRLGAGNYNLTVNAYDGFASSPVLKDSFQTTFLYPFPPEYQVWAASKGLESGVNDMEDDDPDGDRMNNLIEYALGANPLIDDTESHMPTCLEEEDEGTNYLCYIFRRRVNREFHGLDYTVVTGDNLVAGSFSEEAEEVGVGTIDGDFESVTNRIPLGVAPKRFMRLRVTKSQ